MKGLVGVDRLLQLIKVSVLQFQCHKQLILMHDNP